MSWAASRSFALARPGPYRILMAVHGNPHPEWAATELPGMQTLALLEGIVAATLAPHGRSDEAHTVTLCLWASLHGLVSLRLDRPSFPWPPIDELVDHVTQRLTGPAA